MLGSRHQAAVGLQHLNAGKANVAGIQIRSLSYPEYYGGVVHGNQIVIAPGATTSGSWVLSAATM